ncbi:right-handed parallel beta-helix repeat-containing protein [Sulfurimonas sp.]|uniref:right-handed parallel beta-helix repeat-containing protein n=1 Tax=Sulfurimonas sp. TaxID=2022749 RepID=UPI003D11B5D2
MSFFISTIIFSGCGTGENSNEATQRSTLNNFSLAVGIVEPSLGSILGNGIDTSIPTTPTNWPTTESVGYYYIDNTHPDATDSSNTYGYPDKPRISIPTQLIAGSVVEVHGGPYSGNKSFVFNGNANEPIYVYGVGNPKLSGSSVTKIQMSGNYALFEGFDIVGGRLVTSELSNAIIRNLDIDGQSNVNLQNGVSLGGNNIVVTNIISHHHQGDDKHGLTIVKGSENIWVLNSQFHHNGGDGIQFCHGCSDNPPRNIYIGHNTAYGNRENGFDFKYGENIILSSNIAYNHQATQAGVEFCYDDSSGCTTGSSGSDGASIVIGSDGAPQNFWAIGNEVYASANGIRIEEVWNGYLINNIIHNVDAYGIQMEKSGEGPVTIAHNTIYDTPTCLSGPWQGGLLTTTIENNIFAQCPTAWIVYDQEESANNVTITNNLFYNSGGSGIIKLQNDSQTHSTASSINNQVNGDGNFIANPQFISTSEGNFSLNSGSLAIDTATDSYLTYQQDFTADFSNNENILQDFLGTLRPQEENFDIGALEYVE